MIQLRPTTIDGMHLSVETQQVLLIVYECNSVGIGPDFEARFSQLKPVAERLDAESKLMYLTNEDPDSDMASGYCLTRLGNDLGELLFDKYKLEFGQFQYIEEPDRQYRYAVKRTWTHRPDKGLPTVQYIDTGSNEEHWAKPVLRDVQKWDRSAECKLVRVKLPWDGQSIPTEI